MTKFSELPNLASARLGAKAIAANDEFFAPKENLLKDADPTFTKGVFTEAGQLYDGWETRRRRDVGHDWVVVELAVRGVVRGAVVDTSFFTGNYPEACSIEVSDESDGPWVEVVTRSDLIGDHANRFKIEYDKPVKFVRLNIYPDGGVARLRVHGVAVPDWNDIDLCDLASLVNGGSVVECSNQFYSTPNNMLLPDACVNMGDGWETARRRGPGNDWAIVELGTAGTLERIEVDTSHFKGNAPGWISIDASVDSPSIWEELLPKSPVQPDANHEFVVSSAVVRYLRLNIFPDGGVARFRAWGRPNRAAR